MKNILVYVSNTEGDHRVGLSREQGASCQNNLIISDISRGDGGGRERECRRADRTSKLQLAR